MIASERLGYVVGSAAFSAARRKLARLLAEAAEGRLAPIAGAEGGRPPLASTALPSTLPHRRAENSYGMPGPALLCASVMAVHRIAFAAAEAGAANRIGWAGARGTGWNTTAPGTARSAAGGALARIGGGAGA